MLEPSLTVGLLPRFAGGQLRAHANRRNPLCSMFDASPPIRRLGLITDATRPLKPKRIRTL